MSGALRRCRCLECEAPPEPACRICGCDYVPLDDDRRCDDCVPRDEETCAEYAERLVAQARRREARRVERLRRFAAALQTINA